MGAGRVAAIDGEHFEELMADLEASLRELMKAADREPALWARGLPGKWTAGQHVSHIAITLDATAVPFEQRVPSLKRGELPPCPRRGFLQTMWVFLVVRRSKMPRGGKTPPPFEAGAAPDRDATLRSLQEGVERHRALGAGMSPAERDQLWIPNPFHSRWHYTFSEILRVHAVHARHHGTLIREIPASATPAR
jgi:hypothetical protein